MSKNHIVHFVKVAEKKYNPKTHKYDTEVAVISRYAGISDLGLKRTLELFGNLDKAYLVVRMRFSLNDDFDYCVIGDKIYRPTMKRALRVNNSFILSEEVVGEDVARCIFDRISRGD